jgi:hypothetical protein
MDDMTSPTPAPAAPDPEKTAAAQAATNKATAVTQQGLNSTNQVTPQGNLTYSQNGTWSDGTPRFTATTTLSPGQQQIYDQQTQLGGNVNQIALDQTKRVADTLSKPVDLSNDAVEGRLFDLGSKRLDPQFARDWDNRETQLFNRGIMPGTEAYKQEQDAFNRSKNDAYDQLALTGRGQAVQEALTARNQPIDEITALMSGGQVSMPQFGSTPQTSVANTDYSGLASQAWQGQVANTQAKNSYNQALMGGLFGLGGAALGGWGRSGFSMGGK